MIRSYYAALSAGLLTGTAAWGDPSIAGLEEILVTAQHREETVQSTPVSLFTLNAEQLEKQRITSISNLNGLVPNLSIDSFPANNQTLRLFIRGVGLTDTQVTQDAAVGVYLNGAYIARSTGLAFDVADLERIEVLRGPQGTLYGRNTTGGALNLISKKPDVKRLAFKQTFSTGNQDLFSSKTSLNFPLGERYAAKLAYFYQDERGYTKNHGPGGSWGDRESQGFRFDFRALFSEDLTLDYSFDSSDIEYYNLPAQAVTPREPGASIGAIIGVLVEPLIRYDSERISTLNTTVPLLPTDTKIDGHTLNFTWSLSEETTLRSITSWRELSDKSYLDFGSGSAEGFRIDFGAAIIGANASGERLDLKALRPDLEQEQFSQELRLLGTLGDSLEYLAGVYYFYEEAKEDITPTRHIFSAAAFPGGAIYNIGTEYNEIENDAIAFFSQMTWTPAALDRRLHFTLGWRHSQDTRDALRVVTDAVVVDRDTSILELTPATRFEVDTGDDYSDDSFTLITRFDWRDNLNVYAKFAEAYKSGGFNIRDPDEAGFGDGFDEEKLRAVETGFKGVFLDRMLRINAALFHQRFSDFQYNFQIPGTIQGTRVFNIDEGEMSGAELEVMAMPTPWLLLQLSYAYTDSELDDVLSPFTGELRKAAFGNAPKHTYSFVADYSVRDIAFGALNINLSYNYVDNREAQSESTFLDSYSLLNARISLSDIAGLGGEWTVAAWGKNLQDSDYEVFALDNLPQAERAVIWGDARSFGVDVTYHYH